ncbi:MAG: AAA family ATPase [Aeromicrobium sp.]|uniref:AAA family ATPase n=1 Tax=Aeromicrobium sp. TaxID=1871063 RepID=UPI0039E57967
MAVDARDIEAILDAARSEVKRWGGEEASLTHAAFVLSRRWPEEFTQVFGEDGRRQVEQLLRSSQFTGSEQTVRETLAGHDRVAALAALRSSLPTDGEKPASESAPSAETTTARPAAAQASPHRERAPRVDPVPSQTRQREVDELAAQLITERGGAVALAGARGVGRSSILAGLAARLDAIEPRRPVLRLSPDSVVANPEATLDQVLGSLTEPTVLAIDDLERLARLDTESPDLGLLAAITNHTRHEFARLLLIVDHRYVSRLRTLARGLTESWALVSLPELTPEVVESLVREKSAAMAEASGLRLDPAVVSAALTPGLPSEGMSHPGLALRRLDLAIARARVAGDSEVVGHHLATDGKRPTVEAASHDLALVLQNKIKGQSGAVEKVAQRLTLTRAKLDLRPERPNGVFLFVGPTGVGKTELAKEIAVHEYGGGDRLIRLDMSEYAHDWAVSRLTGPAPGYVGSTDPESWLTTKVAAMPRCVVLLDEIEKAHPSIWNTFLQVFDAGRLTDGRGQTCSFADTTIVMTSNLGVREASSGAVGFGSDSSAVTGRILSAVKEQMAPEILNRVDEIALFQHLSIEAITEIARGELQGALFRLSSAGWNVTCSDDVADWLARTGYDEAYGARHLQRNIERELLARLALADSRTVHVTVEADGLVLSTE